MQKFIRINNPGAVRAISLIQDERFAPVRDLIEAWVGAQADSGDQGSPDATVRDLIRAILSSDQDDWWWWDGELAASPGEDGLCVTTHTITGPEADAIIAEELGDDPFLTLDEDGYLTDEARADRARLEDAEAFRQQVRDWDKAHEEGAL